MESGAMMEELKKRYEALYGHEHPSGNAVSELESRLGIQLPEDFKCIVGFFSGGYVGGKSLNTVERGDATNIGDETERLRTAINLPMNMVVLAEPASSLIVMECESGNGKVIWVDATDAPNLSDQNNLHSPETWENYTSFFEELLAEEEEERGLS